MTWHIQPIETEPLIYAIPLFLVAIVAELYILFHDRVKYSFNWKESLSSIAMGLGSLVVAGGVKILALTAFYWVHQFSFFDIGWQWWAWVLLFFADDLSFYIHHRMSHEVRLLWAAHVNHHSSQTLNFATALRQSWTELFYKYIFWLWLPLIGFEPLMVMIMISFSLIFQFLQHTETVKNLGILEWFFNTPSHHRVHHASNIRYLDRNHAGVLIIWDRLFGTFEKERDEEKPIYGITENIHSYNPLVIASHEYISIWKQVRSVKGFSDKLRYIFFPPGWSHTGGDKTARYLRAQLKERESMRGVMSMEGKVL